MKLSGFFITILFACIVIIVPCQAASPDIQISQQVPETIAGYISTDGTFILFQSEKMGPEILVYTAEGILSEKIPLSTETSKLDALAISGGRIYYSEYRSSEPAYWRNETVYEFSLTTGKKRTIYATTAPQQRITRIASDGDHVVLRTGSNEQFIILHTLSNNSNRLIFTSRDSIHDLDISGDHIVWGCERGDREPGREIHVYTISTGTDYIIPESKSDKTYGTVDISGNRVTWTMALHAPYWEEDGKYHGMRGSDIRIIDLDTNITQSVEKNEGYSKSFISGKNVVYMKRPASDSNEIVPATIRYYNVLTGTASDLKNHVLNIDDFKGDLVIWDGEPRLSFFATTLNGTLPTDVSSEITQSTTPIPSVVPQKSSTPDSPVDPVVIVSALMCGVAGYALLKKSE